MYYFFGDERKNYAYLMIVLFSTNKNNLSLISQKIKDFKHTLNLPQNYEFHYYRDSSHINRNFVNFILQLKIEYIFYTHVDFLNEPESHILAFKQLLSQISNKIGSEKVRLVFDKLGGKKTESLLKTEINRLCRTYNINQSDSIKFVDSKESDFIQIADYLAAMIDKKLI